MRGEVHRTCRIQGVCGGGDRNVPAQVNPRDWECVGRKRGRKCSAVTLINASVSRINMQSRARLEAAIVIGKLLQQVGYKARSTCVP